MEMLRTIVVALVFAGITVCTYYYLNSSQFPWEIANPGENVAQTSEKSSGNALQDPALNDPGQSTYAQDGPFTPPPTSMEEGDFSLPGLDELPMAEGTNGSDETSIVAASTAQLPTPPISDTDLPPLKDQNPSPLDMNPAGPIQAQHQGQIGSYANVDETHALPAPDDAPELVLPPDLPSETDPNPGLPAPPSIPDSSASNINQNQGAMTNPLRQNSPPPVIQTPNVAPRPAVEVPIQTNPAPAQAPSNPIPSPPTLEAMPAPTPAPAMDQADAEAEAAAETAAIREYLKIAKEKIKEGQALEVLRQLSKFYGNPRFTAEESSELVEILVLAATQVIYSQKSFLDDPYTVQPDDTVEKIAELYNIPPEFITLVNGLQPGAPLQPGRQLKVVRGPFRVLVYLDRHEMILTLNGLFAGRFWIGVGSELVQKDSDFTFTGKSLAQTGTVSMPCCDFVLTSGEPGSAPTIKIQACTDLNAIGSSAPSGMILMSQTDVQNLSALLGPKSQLLLRCHSLKPVAQQTTPGTNPAAVPPASAPAQAYTTAPVQTPMPGPASVPAPAPAYGSSAELPNSLPSELPNSLPGTGPAQAAPSTADELPLELPATL